MYYAAVSVFASFKLKKITFTSYSASGSENTILLTISVKEVPG